MDFFNSARDSLGLHIYFYTLGDIHWSMPVVIKSSCQVNVAYFPFDHQFCNIDFTSWTYDMNQINIVASTPILNMKDTIENTELSFVNFNISENSIYRPGMMKKYPKVCI